MSFELVLGGAMVVSLNAYALLAGADYGGGVWDLFASGPRAPAQRRLIADVIGPVWEANHVWLIIVVVLMFTCFPPAFGAIATVLHIPITLALIGIVLRGAACTFRAYDSQRSAVQRRWSILFSSASVITPILLGMIVGAIAVNAVDPTQPLHIVDYLSSWLGPFEFAVGAFTLALFAFLAAVYLTVESRGTPLAEDFRMRALISGVCVGALALLVFMLSGSAPNIRAGLSASVFAIPLHATTAVCALAAFYTLYTRRYFWARLFAAAQVSLILWGWALAQFPDLLGPHFTLFNAAAPAVTLRVMLIALGSGSFILLPSLYCLYRVFRRSDKDALGL